MRKTRTTANSAKSAGAPKLFTIVMEFEGTTSVAQLAAPSVEEAVRLWVGGLAKARSYGLNKVQRSRLITGFERIDTHLNLAPAPLRGLRNVWCTTISADPTGLLLLNIIETKPGADRSTS